MCGLCAFVTLLHPSRTNSVLQRGTAGLYLMLFAFIGVVDAHLVLGEYLGIHSCHGGRNERSWLTAGLGSGLVQSLGIKCPMCIPEPGGNGNGNAVFWLGSWRRPAMQTLLLSYPNPQGFTVLLSVFMFCCIFSINAVFSLQNELWSVALLCIHHSR